MEERSKIATSFYIDDHAALYGMLTRAADRFYGDKGDTASAHATKVYATERGTRMKKRAQEDHMPLTPDTYRLYTEWEDVQKKMTVETICLTPAYRMNGTYCVWNETWKKYHLEKYGRIYCSIVDQTMVRSFNPENELIIHSTLSQDGAGCDFEWVGLQYDSPGALQDAFRKKQAFRQRAIKDFLYHCGHVLSAMKRGYIETLGHEAAGKISACAMEEYGMCFGKSKVNAILGEATRDFQAI